MLETQIKVLPPENSKHFERIGFEGNDVFVELFELKYHFKYWFGTNQPYWIEGNADSLRLTEYSQNGNTVTASGTIPELAELELKYLPKGETLGIQYSFKSIADKELEIGFYFLGIEFPVAAESWRILSGVYNGYTDNQKTVLFENIFHEDAGLYQIAPAIDQTSRIATQSNFQYLTMSFPPSYKDGAAKLAPGQEVKGEMAISFSNRHIWDPELKKEELNRRTNAIQDIPARFPYEEYVKNWEKFIQDPDKWVDLSEDMGMYHVGFYKHLADDGPMNGGPFGYTINGKPIWYKEVQELLASGQSPEEAGFSTFQQNIRQLEIAWGNGNNAMQAYAHYQHGGEWFENRAARIVNAILRLKGSGFQILEGPMAGAWIGAYDADNDRFQDHYGAQQVFMPDQGIVNHFLARIYLENFNRDPEIIAKIAKNCALLKNIEKRYGTFPNALDLNGEIGYAREGYLYDKPKAPGVANAALSFLVLYELTDDRRHLEEAERIIEEHLSPLIMKHQFGHLEYDHNGHDSAGACTILIALAEYLDLPDMRLEPLVKQLQEKTFYYLLSFRHENDYHAYEHSTNLNAWNAKAFNVHAYMHGYTRGSRQGEFALHNRYEYGYALMRTWQTWPGKLTKSAMDKHLNLMTWQQYINPDFTKGFGGMTEHIAMRTYVQDTTHLVHSTQLPLILAWKNNQG